MLPLGVYVGDSRVSLDGLGGRFEISWKSLGVFPRGLWYVLGLSPNNFWVVSLGSFWVISVGFGGYLVDPWGVSGDGICWLLLFSFLLFVLFGVFSVLFVCCCCCFLLYIYICFLFFPLPPRYVTKPHGQAILSLRKATKIANSFKKVIADAITMPIDTMEAEVDSFKAIWKDVKNKLLDMDKFAKKMSTFEEWCEVHGSVDCESHCNFAVASTFGQGRTTRVAVEDRCA